MSEFYNTFTALVAHLQSTLPAKPSAEQQALLSTALFKLHILKRCMGSARRNLPLIDDLQALFESPEKLTAMLSTATPGGALVLRSVEEVVELAAEMASLILASAPTRQQ